MQPEATNTQARPGHVTAFAHYGINDGVPRGFGQAPPDHRAVTFHDMRGYQDPPTLEREGFALVKHSSSVLDFNDADRVATVYLPEIQALVQGITGSRHVFMQSNWVLRAQTNEAFSGMAVAGGKHVNKMRTGGFLHIDYDAPAAERWAQRAFTDAGVAERPQGRLLVLTVWRAISPPPQDKPLALIDRRTVTPENLILETISAPHTTWNGYQLTYNSAHRFCWWSDMTRDEVILFIQHEDGVGPISAAPHAAFDNPACSSDVATRQSIEVRAYAFL